MNRRVVVPALVVLWIACGPITRASAATGTVTGSATYRERLALTTNAVFEAELQDVSRADAPAEVIAQDRKINPSQVPITFEIAFDPQRIKPRGRYAVRAWIHEGGRLMFVSDRAYPVLTQGRGDRVNILMRRATRDDVTRGFSKPERTRGFGPLPATYAGLLPCADCMGIRYQINLLPAKTYMQRMTYLRDGHDDSYYELGAWSLSDDGRVLDLESNRQSTTHWQIENDQTLRKLDREGKPIASDLPYTLRRSEHLEPMSPRVRMLGMFRYMADAATFRECRTGASWPVAMSHDYIEVERAYVKRDSGSRSEMLVSINGRIEELPRMEGGGTMPTLVVEEFLGAMPGDRCEETRPRFGLENNRWRPVRIGGRSVTVSGNEREPWIHLDPREKRVTGSGGCNRISGTYQAGDGLLRFGPIISTKMACPGVNVETAFLGAIEATRRYRNAGRTLELLDSQGRLLAQLEERNLR